MFSSINMATPSQDPYPWKEPSKPVTRGAFIVIEGLDRAGKTTQVKKLCDTLYAKGHNVKAIGFPDRTSQTGQTINSYLQNKTDMGDHAMHLLFSANRWEKAAWIKETIQKGYTLVCDRYYYSGLVYSAAKRNPELSLEWARGPVSEDVIKCLADNSVEVGLPRPDRVVFLDLEPEEAQKRGGYGEEKYEKKEMQERVREGFLGLIGRGEEESYDMKLIDAGASAEEVERRIWDEVGELVRKTEGGEGIGDLGIVGAWEA